jgi:hypothetical protein
LTTSTRSRYEPLIEEKVTLEALEDRTLLAIRS